MPPTSPPSAPRNPWLRTTDQVAAALIGGVALAVIGGLHWWQGGTTGRLIEIEQAAPIRIEYQVDINRADTPEFLVLPEIGEALAHRIIEDREARGPFRDHRDLQRVRGIGPKTLERIRPYLLPMAEAEAVAGN